MPYAEVQTLVIPIKVPSWNALARKHYRVYQHIFHELAEATRYAILSQKLRPLTQFPAKLHFHARFKYRKRRDIDSVCLKPIVDALVTLGILPGDDLTYLGSVTVTGEIGASGDSLEITLWG